MSQSWKIREVKDIPRGRPVMSHHLAWPFMNAMLFIRRGQNRQNHMQQLSQEVEQNEVASSVKGFSGCHPSQRSLVILLPEYGMLKKWGARRKIPLPWLVRTRSENGLFILSVTVYKSSRILRTHNVCSTMIFPAKQTHYMYYILYLYIDHSFCLNPGTCAKIQHILAVLRHLVENAQSVFQLTNKRNRWKHQQGSGRITKFVSSIARSVVHLTPKFGRFDYRRLASVNTMQTRNRLYSIEFEVHIKIGSARL